MPAWQLKGAGVSMRRMACEVSALLAALLLSLFQARALAVEPPGFYVSGGIGAGYASNGRLAGTDAEVDFDLGRPIGTVALGLEAGRRWRFELDGSYRYNDAEVVFFRDGRPDLAPDSRSRIEASSLAVSVIRDFDLLRGFRPYLGAGLGAARVDYRIDEYITGRALLDDGDTAAAYQLIAGFALNLTPRADLLLDYRYWRAPDISLEDVAGNAIDTGHRVHSALASLRFRPGNGRRQGPAGPASDRGGWYARATAGASFAKDAEIKDNIANFDAFDVGSVTTAAVGRAWGRRWRVELEAARRSHEAELIDFNPEFGEDRADGRVRARSLLANAIYEPQWRTAFQPYAALGLGLAWADWDVVLAADGATYVDDADSAGAFQVVFGAAAALTARLDVTAEYRYWMTALLDLHEPDGRPMRTELTVNSLMLGLRYRLR